MKLAAGIAMGMILMMHIGIKRGEVKAPGLWMTNNGRQRPDCPHG